MNLGQLIGMKDALVDNLTECPAMERKVKVRDLIRAQMSTTHGRTAKEIAQRAGLDATNTAAHLCTMSDAVRVPHTDPIVWKLKAA